MYTYILTPGIADKSEGWRCGFFFSKHDKATITQWKLLHLPIHAEASSCTRIRPRPPLPSLPPSLPRSECALALSVHIRIKDFPHPSHLAPSLLPPIQLLHLNRLCCKK